MDVSARVPHEEEEEPPRGFLSVSLSLALTALSRSRSLFLPFSLFRIHKAGALFFNCSSGALDTASAGLHRSQEEGPREATPPCRAGAAGEEIF